MGSVPLAVIHNGELQQSPAREVVERLQELDPQICVLEIVEQAPLDPEVDVNALRAWAEQQWRLERRWREYRGVQSWWRQALAVAGHKWWRARIAWSPQFREQAWRARQIEERVTRKHIEAWESGVSGGVLVLESDATWIPDRSPTLTGLVNAWTLSKPVYCNLAGGLDEFHIRTRHLASDQPAADGDPHSEVVEFDRAVTNTSCAYFINAELAQEMLDVVAERPDLKALGVDWLINSLFMELAARGVQVRCVHADPPALGHGSRTGVTESWHPGR